MKAVNEISNSKIPLVAIDRSLDKYEDQVMFPKKLAKANKALASAKLPPKKKHG